MQIRSLPNPQLPPRRTLPSHSQGFSTPTPLAADTLSPSVRFGLVGGAAVAATGLLAAATGMRLGEAVGIVVPLTLLGIMGASLWSSMEPDVPLQPELDSFLVGRFHDDQKQAVQKALNALGSDNVQRLRAGGVKLVVDGARVPDKAAACYFAGERLVAFRRSEVTKGIAIHELGHALDSLALPESQRDRANFLSQVDEKLLGNYRDYLERTHSERSLRSTRWSEYAQTNEREYLAEGVTWYLQTPEQKAELQKKDPQHYAYVEQFLVNPGPS